MSAPVGAATEAWRLGALELADAFRRGALTPASALDACLARIDAVDPTLNAFVARADVARLHAEAAASAARWAAGTPASPLDGVPVAVKDNLPTADLPTTWGSVALKDHRPARDELAVARLRAGGLLVLGKTNVPEFTLEGYTSNALFGTTRNPWDPRRTPGGSSGGSVAAVASGMAPLALGTDGGGSTRRPAAHTGLVGLKPSIGAIPRVDALPPLLLDFEVVGTIGRTVADVAALFGVLAGADPADRRSVATAATRRALPERLRVRYVATLGGAPVDPHVAASCRAAAAALVEHGHAVDEGPLPLELGPLVDAWPKIGQAGLAWLFAQRPAWRDGAGARYLEMAAQGERLGAAWLWDLLETVDRLRRDVDRVFDTAGIDLIVTPSAAALPWPADAPFPPVIDGRSVGPRGHAIFTGWVNAAGVPALALPSVPSPDGLPIGVQLIGPFGSDAALLALGAQVAPSLAPPWRMPPAVDPVRD